MRVRLSGGAPDEPDTGDWDAICSTPGPNRFFAALFPALTGEPMPAEVSNESSEDDITNVHTIWCGSEALGARVIEIECTETTAFMMHSRWETFGLPGVKALWQFSLDRAGQLGYCAFRHGSLECTFDSPAAQTRFTEVWRKVFDREPQFEPA